MKERERRLIPRKTLFGNPERTAVTISHDGTRVAYLGPAGRCAQRVGGAAGGDRACRTGDPRPRQRHQELLLGLPSRFILYLQDRDGDENSLPTSRPGRYLTPYDGVNIP